MTHASRRHVLQGALFGAACACAGARIAFAADAPPTSPSGKWTCPPCGCSNDGKLFDAPGVCSAPDCGMDLIPAPSAQPKPAPGAPKADAASASAGGGFMAASDRAPMSASGRTGWGTRTRT
ncbi:heavy metal-binding domain-containing protein [Phenylobacterium sp.]|uniref:heavy metal-binding domain-containing protein n=1 Tax=Phenylobacterium sp. TaxID=1871053 RepID=UPI001208A61C|nr:heavy metal-binding domain-containing protein [Phenylobacterium sp.]THD62586.1 MAG: hypothetical protein E8A49_07370 [Phenylobacterium sp.]